MTVAQHHAPMSPSCSTSSSMDHNDSAVAVTPGEADCGELVKDPVAADVLCGRGGSINSHPGNEKFRTLVEKRKRVYLTARFKREKRLIASAIVNEIRAAKGRFLTRDVQSGLWRDIGDEKARDKTSQALRENAPSIRAEIEEEINEQRAEMYKDERSGNGGHAPHHQYPHHPGYPPYPHPPPPPPPNGYYNGWFPPYYGYPHPPPPPPPPPGHVRPGYGYPHPPPPPAYDPHYYPTQPDPYASAPQHPHPSTPAPPSQQSQQHPPLPVPPAASHNDHSTDFVTAGAESFRNWTRNSFSFGGGSTSSLGGGSQQHESQQQPQSVSSAETKRKPIAYKHEQRSKMVKFRDSNNNSGRQPQPPEQPRRVARPAFSPVQQQQQQDAHSLLSGMSNHSHHTLNDDMDMEPQPVDSDPNTSLMAQVAHHILGNFGSWDTLTVCGMGDAAPDKVTFPQSSTAPSGGGGNNNSGYYAQAENDVEWEGQEVQLVDERREDDRSMPPPPPRDTSAAAAAAAAATTQQHHSGWGGGSVSIGFSSLGSCHSWIPEQMGAAASYFSGRDMDCSDSAGGGNNNNANHYNHRNHPPSQYAENYSLAGSSVGGNSLAKIFEGEVSPSSNNNGGQRTINQVPSWERSFRSRSPVSLGDDDESLISKTSSKGGGGALSPVQSAASGDMTWTSE